MNVIRAILADHPLFESMKREHLDILASSGRQENFRTGDLILRQGEPATQFFLILEGKVALESHDLRQEDTLLQELGAGEIVGWSWLFPPFVSHFQARASTNALVVAFDGARMLIASEKDPSLGYDLMRRIAQVVIHRLQASRKLYVQSLKEARSVPNEPSMAST